MGRRYVTKNPDVIKIDKYFKGTCPICNQPYQYITSRRVHGKVYFYAHHEKKACCLGPKQYSIPRPYSSSLNPILADIFREEMKEKTEQKKKKRLK